MNILVCCEESQRVCMAFRDLGHNSFSCDIQPCSGGFPEYHILGDCLPLINGNCSFFTEDSVYHFQPGKWDMLICFPPCTYLTNVASCRLFDSLGNLNQSRFEKGLSAKEFFLKFYNADCDKICIENPVPSKIFGLPGYTQIIEPYYFGEPFTKKTCLWLKGLPILFPTDFVIPEKSYVFSVSGSKLRSKTFLSVARAMASQWSM